MAARSSATLDLPGGPGTTGARKKGGLTAWFAQERVFRLIPFLLVEGTFLLLLAIPFVLTILMYYAILIPHTSQSLLGVRWSLFDTYLGLGMLYMATALPFVIWMMLSFIDEVPTTLEHAARLMGAGRLYTLRRVVLPLVASGMVVTFLFILILNWSEFLLALTLTQPHVSTLPVLLNASRQLLPKAELGRDKARCIAVRFLIPPVENPVTRG